MEFNVRLIDDNGITTLIFLDNQDNEIHRVIEQGFILLDDATSIIWPGAWTIREDVEQDPSIDIKLNAAAATMNIDQNELSKSNTPLDDDGAVHTYDFRSGALSIDGVRFGRKIRTH